MFAAILVLTILVAVAALGGGLFFLLPLVLAPVAFGAVLTIGAVIFAVWLAFFALRIVLWTMLGVGGALVGLVVLPFALLAGVGALVIGLAPVWLPLLAIVLVVWALNRQHARQRLASPPAN